MADQRGRALAALRDGRVRVTTAKDPRVVAEVRSSRPDWDTPYTVNRWLGSTRVMWSCTCRLADCVHQAAVALVTYPDESAARKP